MLSKKGIKFQRKCKTLIELTNRNNGEVPKLLLFNCNNTPLFEFMYQYSMASRNLNYSIDELKKDYPKWSEFVGL